MKALYQKMQIIYNNRSKPDLGEYFLRWNIKRDSPKVHHLAVINAGDDEEEAGTHCSALQMAWFFKSKQKKNYLLDSPKAENNCPFIFLNNFDAEEHGDGEGAHQEDDGDDGEEDCGAAAANISVPCSVIGVSFWHNVVSIHDRDDLDKDRWQH